MSHEDRSTAGRHGASLLNVNQRKRVTIYFDPEVHKALRLKGAATDRSVSEMVNEAVSLMLAEDARDAESVKARRTEPTIDFETFVRHLKRRRGV